MRTGSPQRAPGRHSVRQPPGSSPAGRRRYPGAVRLTVFWDKMRVQFGDAYAASVARDHALGGAEPAKSGSSESDHLGALPPHPRSVRWR